jgi:hypothetical protein
VPDSHPIEQRKGIGVALGRMFTADPSLHIESDRGGMTTKRPGERSPGRFFSIARWSSHRELGPIS